MTVDWLDPYVFRAIYNTPTEALTGTFTVHSYTSEADLWRFVGTFERADF